MRYTRDFPSPRYDTLIAQAWAMHTLAPHPTFTGRSLGPHVRAIRELLAETGSTTVLDYGAGKGQLYAQKDLELEGEKVGRIADFWGARLIRCYDPAYPPHAPRPDTVFDAVVCTDVLEHCPEEDLPWILEDIFGFARRCVYLSVATYKAVKQLPNGENAHVTVRPARWWKALVESAAARHPTLQWLLHVTNAPDQVETVVGSSRAPGAHAAPAVRTAKKRRVLYYVEPVVFRENPGFLFPWAAWISDIARSNSHSDSGYEFGVAANAHLLDRFRELARADFAFTQALPQAGLVAPFGFDRRAYARDLFAPEAEDSKNAPLEEALRHTAEAFQPDLVISFTQNRYLRRAFGCPVLFTEVAPLPRQGRPLSFFFDPCGHQTESMLNGHLDAILLGARAAPSLERFQTAWSGSIEKPALLRGGPLGEALKRQAAGRKVVLLCHQPDDWLTNEGTGNTLSLSEVLASWLASVPEGWCALPVYHPAQAVPAELERLIQRELGGRMLPAAEEVRIGGAELVLPYVDAVATISSSVGVQAALWGKPVVARGTSFLSRLGSTRWQDLDRASGLSAEERLALFAFLTHRYCQPMSRLADRRGGFVQFLEEWKEARHQPSFFTDLDGWNLEHARSLTLAS
jgi:hypothetical protein